MPDIVQTGLARLLEDSGRLNRLKGARIGLLVNPTSITLGFVHAIEALQESGLNICRLFGPEHGVRADAQDMEAVDETIDRISQLPVVSLYGHCYESLMPQAEYVADLDVVIADIQDIGARYYTYVYTIGLMMKVCGEVGTKVMVLDRPNPINGVTIEGNQVRDEFRSFVGMQPLATRHAMTAGELAHYFQKFTDWTCELEVVEMAGWRRQMWYDETGLPWIMTSPNMPTLDTATVYPGQCLLEGTNCSEARGTTRPFELFGAPYVDAVALKRVLMSYELPGVGWRLAAFRPGFQKHSRQTCRGLQLHVVDRAVYDSFTTGLAVLAALLNVCGSDFQWRTEAYEFVDDQLAIDLLFGDDQIRMMLEDGASPLEVSMIACKQRGDFEMKRLECLIYD